MSFDENSKVSGNAYSGRPLKRMEIQYKDINIKFAVNPSDYTQSKPNKVTLTQTKGGAWIDAWGAGIVEFSIKGTTGVKGGSKDIDTGYNRWKELEKLFDSLYAAITDGEEVKDLIRFYNHTDNEFYYCYPNQSGIELYRSSSKPHLYQYSIGLWGIRKIGQPEVSVGVIGNLNRNNNSVNKKGKRKTKTTYKQKGKHAGGEGSYTIPSNANKEVDFITTTSTKTKTLSLIKDDCVQCSEELEPLVGGKAGKLSPVTGYNCITGINIQSLGVITNVSGFRCLDWSTKPDIYLKDLNFTSKVSNVTYEVYKKIKEQSDEVLSTAYCTFRGLSAKQRVIQAIKDSKQYDSTLYEQILLMSKSFSSKEVQQYLKIVLLDAMAVYIEVYRMSIDDNYYTALTSVDMLTMIRNTQSVIMWFEYKNQTHTDNTEFDFYSLCLELRKLEKVLTEVNKYIVSYL